MTPSTGSSGIPFVILEGVAFNPHTVVTVKVTQGNKVRITFINNDVLDIDNGDTVALHKKIRDAMAAQL